MKNKENRFKFSDYLELALTYFQQCSILDLLSCLLYQILFSSQLVINRNTKASTTSWDMFDFLLPIPCRTHIHVGNSPNLSKSTLHTGTHTKNLRVTFSPSPFPSSPPINHQLLDYTPEIFFKSIIHLEGHDTSKPIFSHTKPQPLWKTIWSVLKKLELP